MPNVKIIDTFGSANSLYKDPGTLMNNLSGSNH